MYRNWHWSINPQRNIHRSKKREHHPSPSWLPLAAQTRHTSLKVFNLLLMKVKHVQIKDSEWWKYMTQSCFKFFFNVHNHFAQALLTFQKPHMRSHSENHPSCSDSKPQWLQVLRRAQLKPQSIYLLVKAKAGLVTSHLWKIMNTAVEKNTFTERTTEVRYKRNIEITPASILLLFSSQERTHDLIKFITWGSK